MLVSKVQPRNKNKCFFKGICYFILFFIHFEFDLQMFCNIVGKYVVKLGNDSMFDNQIQCRDARSTIVHYCPLLSIIVHYFVHYCFSLANLQNSDKSNNFLFFFYFAQHLLTTFVNKNLNLKKKKSRIKKFQKLNILKN